MILWLKKGGIIKLTEQQKFDVVERIKKFEIRHYHPCVLAEVSVTGQLDSAASLGFRPLVTYISQNGISMTAPVLQEKVSDQSWLVSFVMPANAKLEDLPLPQNTQVTLKKVPAHYAAALIFSGGMSKEKILEKESQLREFINENKFQTVGTLKIARYDPPWKPGFLRQNEVIFEIEKCDHSRGR